MKRQNLRKVSQITSLLLFPIIMYYLSPYLIIDSALKHIINGSCIFFLILLVLSPFLGRLFCAYICPTGALQECCFLINNKPLKRDWKYFIKYIIWLLWLGGVITAHLLGKGDYKIDFLYMTDHGISISEIANYFIYYLVILCFFIPAIFAGKRFACHYFCWMGPFMIIGAKVGRALHLPQVHIKADASKCASCNRCTQNCPMSIDVKSKVQEGKIIDSECIQCGTCIDTCPNKVLRYTMKNK